MIRRGALRGHAAIFLENEHLAVVVLPDRGAEIHQVTHLPTATTFLLEAPDGLPPPTTAHRDGFLDGYAGGWQELFPNVNDACRVDGVDLPFHGEVTLRPWETGSTTVTADHESIVLRSGTPGLGVRLEREMRILHHDPVLRLVETITNERAEPVQVAWGHHLVLGGSFLREGCRMDLGGGLVTTPNELYEPATASLAPGQRRPWPFAIGRSGEVVDLRQVPGAEAHIHDDIFIYPIDEGRVTVSDPATGLAIQVTWDESVFRCLVNWRPLGGADEPPLTGIYGMGIEPWTSPDDLAQARERGEALTLGSSASMTTALEVRIKVPAV